MGRTYRHRRAQTTSFCRTHRTYTGLTHTHKQTHNRHPEIQVWKSSIPLFPQCPTADLFTTSLNWRSEKRLEMLEELRALGSNPSPSTSPPCHRNLGFCSPELGSSLPGRPAWRRGGAESAESRNAAGLHCSSLSEPRPPPQQHPRGTGHLAVRVLPLSGARLFYRAATGKCPFPTPILTRCRQPGGSDLSPVQGVPEDAGEKAKGHPLPSHPSKWR